MKTYTEFLTEFRGFKYRDAGLPYIQDMIKDPAYFKEKKGIEFRVVYMTPDKYLQAAAKGFGESVSALIRGRKSGSGSEHISKMAAEMKSGVKYDTPLLDYSRGNFSQEGIHRSLAAKEAGIKKIPVIIVTDSKKKKSAPAEKQAAKPDQGILNAIMRDFGIK